MSEFSMFGIGDFSREYASDRVFEKLIISEYLNNLVDELDQLERDTILMYFFNSMSFGEIAEFLNKPKSTVHAAKNSGVQKLFFVLMRDKGILESNGWSV